MNTETADRLERLAARHPRQHRAVAPPEQLPAPGVPVTDVDAALRARLEGLSASRRSTAPTPAPNRKRRRHPAQHSRTAALALSFVATGGLGYLMAVTDSGAAAAPAAPAGIVPSAPVVPATTGATSPIPVDALVPPSTAAPAASTVTPATTAAPAPAVPAAPQAITVNGQSFRNKWGDVQVQATFGPDGTLVAVDTLQVPFRDGKSVRINDYAVPRLNSEALTAQNAQIDTVSGATYTSIGYQQSLQSAIDIAVANGIPAASGQA